MIKERLPDCDLQFWHQGRRIPIGATLVGGNQPRRFRRRILDVKAYVDEEGVRSKPGGRRY